MKKLLIAFTVSLWAIGQAYAGSTTVSITPGTGVNVSATTDGSSNVYWRNTLWDYAAGANGAGVDTSHGLLVDPASAAAWGVGATGSTVPANANYMGIISGGNLVGWTGAVTQGTQGSTGSPWYVDLPSATPASSNLGQVLADPPNLTYQATWGSVCSYSSGNNAWCGDPKGAAWLDLGAVNGTAISLGQTTKSASLPVTIASDQTAGDPCSNFQAKSFADFESTSSGGSIITAVSSKKAYICSVAIVTSAAANVSLIEGTGSSVCTGGTTAGVYLNTGVTAANGASVGATSGIAASGGGTTLAANATANQNVCVLFTTTNTPQVNVHVSYVQQ